MLEVYFDLNKTISTLEGLLHIQPDDYDTDGYTAINQIAKRLGAAYCVDLTTGGFMNEEVRLMPGIGELIQNLAQIYMEVSAITISSVYRNEVIADLSNISYMGFTKESVAGLASIMTMKDYADSLDTLFAAILNKYERFDISLERKIILLTIVLYKLGLREFTAPFGSILLNGMLIGGDKRANLLFN